MTNPYYNRQTECNPGELADGTAIEAEFDSLQRAFDKLPAPHRDGGGFEVPVRVGAAVSNDEAAQLAQINALLEGFLSKSGNLAGLAAPGTALSNLGVSTFIKTLLDDADAATARATLGAQTSDATLTALAGVTTAADKLPYFTGVDAAAVATLTAFARTLLDDADAATARATLGAQASDATLTALAGLATGTDKFPYSTGTDIFAQADLTSFARTLLDDVDAAAMRSTLDLVKQTTNADSTPGRLLLVGSGGICAAGAIPGISGLTNCDDIATSGFYSVNAGTTNWAFGGSGGVIMHMSHGTNKYQTQLAFSSTGEVIKYRTNPNGVWGSWRDLLHSGNTVKQAGNYDTTSGALLSVGAFGVNGVGPLIETADFNSKVIPGRYFMQAASSNSPNSAIPLILEVEGVRVDTGGGGGRIRQIASGYGTNEGYIWSRSSPDAGSSWTGWMQHWNGQVMPYESGAFTPTVFGSTTAGVTTYSSQAGRYTRIGERVFFDMVLQWTAATGTGNLCIGGLPFTSKAGVMSAQMSVAVQNIAASVPISAMLGSLVNYMVIRSMANGSNWTDVAMDPAAEIRISGSYVIA